VDQDRLGDLILGFEQREQLVDEVDVPNAFDLGDHHHVELVADGGDDLVHVVQEPGAVERIDPGPQAGFTEVDGLRHLDEAGTGGLLGIGGDGVLEVAEKYVDLLDHVGHSGAELLDVRGEKMDHPLGADGQFAHRLGRADGKRLVEIRRQFHGFPSPFILAFAANRTAQDLHRSGGSVKC